MKNFFTLLFNSKQQVLGLVIALVFITFGVASMTAQTSTQAGPWESTATWGGNPVPTSSSSVTIGHAVTMAGTASAPATVTFVSSTTTVATITTSAAHGFIVGQYVSITGVTNNSNYFTGGVTIVSVPTATSFTYSKGSTAYSNVAATGTTPAVSAGSFSFGGTMTIATGGSLVVNAGVTLTLNNGATINKLVNGAITATAGATSGLIIYGTSTTGVINVNIGSATDPAATISTTNEIGTGSVGNVKVKIFAGFTYDILTTTNKQIGDLTVDGTLQATNTSSFIILKGGLTVGSAGVISTRVSFRFFGGTPTYSPIISIPEANTGVKDIEFRTTTSYTLTNNTTINGTLSFPTAAAYAGKLNLAAFNFTAPIVTGGNTTSSWAAAAGAGRLIIPNVGATAVTFPIGTLTEFLPITSFINSGTADEFGANISASVPSCLGTGTSLTAKWDVAETTVGGSNVSMTVQYNATTAGFANLTANARLRHCTGTTADFPGAAAGSGAGPYTISTTGVTSFSPFGVGEAAVLAVELNNIKATQKGATNLISWSTASEKDNASFIVERSANGQDFAAIGTVKGSGTSASEKNYTFSDETPLSTSYYRVKSVDYTGGEATSKVVSVQRGKTTSLKVYPSPVSEVLTVEMGSMDNATFTVVDIAGRTMLRQAAANQINVSALSKGLYFLTVEVEGSKITQKFVKQ